MADAHEVPHKYDIVLDGEGYCFYRPWSGGESANAPQLGIHSFSPAFVPRTNMSGTYGDDQQDFYLTFSQKDWSLGEQQKYQERDQRATRRYWIGTNVDIRTAGQVSLRRQTRTVTPSGGGEDVRAAASKGTNTGVFVATSSNLYTISPEGTVTDHGAHGLGASPAEPHGMTTDGANAYMTDSSAGKVRKWDGSSFSDFSADGANGGLAYLNNTLYGFGEGNLYRWTSAGVRSTLHTWQDADGDAHASVSSSGAQIIPFGGKLLINISRAGNITGSTWIYDGVGVSKIFDHPINYISRSICVVGGTVFVAGYFNRFSGSSSQFRSGIMYYANGSIGILWQSDTYVTQTADLEGAFVSELDGGVLFTDDTTEKFMWYDLSNGGVHSVSSYVTGGTGASCKLTSTGAFVLLQNSDRDVYQFPHNSSVATTGTIVSSLIDFDNSLKKVFSGIKIEYDEGSDGDGGSIDIAYRVGDLDGSYTTLQTGATAGTEYTLTNITGRSISVKLTLNKGTSTNGPVLKRLYVRAAPFGNSRHRALLHLDCTDDALDNTESPLSSTGHARAEVLMMAAEAETVLSYTDAFETMNVVVESCELTQIRPAKREFVASVVLREA